MRQIKIIKSRIMAVVLFALVSSSTVFAQTATTKHIVERGETVESIAQKYGVTKDEIVKLNPDAAQFVYVGMELVVPKIANQEMTKKKTAITNDTALSSEKSSATDHTIWTNKSSDKFKIGVVAGYSINNYTGKDIKDTKNQSGFHVGLDLRYHINKYLFAEGSLEIATKGYKKEEFDTSGEGWDDEGPNYDITTKTTMSTINLEIPLYIGANYEGFFIKTGPYLSYVLSGKKKSDVKDIYYEDIHSSSEGNNTYETKIGDMKNFKRMTVGLSAGIGYCYNNFLIQFTYQRGLSKLFKKSKQYEQNMLISVGYFF